MKKNGSQKSLRVIIDDIITKSGGHGRYIKLAQEDDKTFLDLYNKRITLEPKQTSVDNTICIEWKGLTLPRPVSETKQKLDMGEAEVIDVELSTGSQAQIDELSTGDE